MLLSIAGEKRLRPTCWQLAWKRTIDIVASAGGLAVFWPLLLFLAALIGLIQGLPVLFVQLRPGQRGRVFRLLKFRTMREACGTRGAVVSDKARLTSIGAILRKTSLDELPQLINVLKGDMSLVGPRPLLVQYLPRYTDRQRRRHEVRPGITGWAQVNGRNGLTWEQKFELDVWYVDHWSLVARHQDSLADPAESHSPRRYQPGWARHYA